MLRKDLRLKQNEEPLEFKDLREACTSKKGFVDLIDRRMELPDEEIETSTTFNHNGQTHGLVSWLQGGAVIHREGATQAPWDCQVDILMEWQGSSPLDQDHLNG